MAKVFVSYSRKDIEFAKRLTAELQKSDLDFWIDWEGIPPTVDWWKEIEKGIEEADVFLFLISPDSARSKVCVQEIDSAVKNGKRLIPLVVRDIKGDETPSQLGHLNWIFFRESDDYDSSLKKLLTSIHTDYDWVQSHRRLQMKALEWERNHKESSFLLRGKDLQDAEFQLATNTSKEPHPTDLQREYVFESRKAADRQRRITTGASIGAAIALAAFAVFGLVQARNANIQASIAQTARADAERSLGAAQIAQADAEGARSAADSARATAVANEEIAKSQANIAATAQANAESALRRVKAVASYRAQALVSFSQSEGDQTSPLAVLLAIEAYQTAGNIQTTSRLFELLQTEELTEGQFRAENGVYVVTFNPQGDQLAVGYDNRGEMIRLWQVPSQIGQGLPLRGHKDGVYSIAFSPDGTTLASGGFDSKIIFWDPETRQAVTEPPTEHNRRIYSIAYSPDGKWLASGGMDTHIIVWDTATGKKVRQLDGHEDTIFSLAFSPDGKILASGGRDNTLIFWDMETFEVLGTPIKKHNNFIFNLAFGPGGMTLATADQGGSIYLWDVEKRETIGDALVGHQGEVSSVAFSPDGKFLASGGYDSQVILWDVTTRQQFAKLPTTDRTDVISVAFSPDGALLALGNKSGLVTLWHVQPTFWVERACELAGRNFDQNEWEQYFPGEDYRITCPQ